MDKNFKFKPLEIQHIIQKSMLNETIQPATTKPMSIRSLCIITTIGL